MGGGVWSAATYSGVTSSKIRTGTTFGYDRSVRSSGVYKAHEDLNPKKLNKAGLNVRESRDSTEHPNSLPIIVAFDSTGSMGSVPRVMQQKLGTVFKLLVDKGYAKDPQVAVATYGDAHCDSVPLQFGQFESDNRVDDTLDNMFLEGGGGGNNGETSNLLLYYAATHTETDSWDKRKHKGHLFLIADEKQVPIDKDHVCEVIGDKQPLLDDLSNESIAKAVTEKWHVWVLLIDNSAARFQRSHEFYANLFGEKQVLIVEDPNNIAETIAAVVGFAEGTDRTTIERDLTETAGKEIALRVGKTLTRKNDAGPKALR